MSDLITTYSKEKEKFKLDLRIYNEESFDVTIPFKKRTDVSINGFQYYNTTTTKQETIEFYDYYVHWERFYFTWKNDQLEFEYSVKLSADKKKLMKKISLRKSTRRKLCIDELRMLCVNLRSHETKNILFEYIEGNFIESVLEITRNDTKDLKNLTVQQKKRNFKTIWSYSWLGQKFYVQDQKDTQF